MNRLTFAPAIPHQCLLTLRIVASRPLFQCSSATAYEDSSVLHPSVEVAMEKSPPSSPVARKRNGQSGMQAGGAGLVRSLLVRVWFDAIRRRERCPASELAARYGIPTTALFDLYEAFSRNPGVATLSGIDEVVSLDGKMRALFGGTLHIRLVGTNSLILSDTLSDNPIQWRIILSHDAAG
jgi:hypothetical protein